MSIPPKPKYHYDFANFNILQTKVGDDATPWVLECMNKVGAMGLRIWGQPQLTQEASAIRGPMGPIPHLNLNIPTEEVYYGAEYVPRPTIKHESDEFPLVADEEPSL